jgi:sulfur relay protein TusB/DsrH
MTEASATLHLVFSPAGLAACQAQLATGDAIVLLEDGVSARAACKPLAGMRCRALGPDLSARGLSVEHDTVHSIDHGALVSLCIAFARSSSWR